MKKDTNIIEITAEMAAEVGVILRGGPRFVAACTLVSKGRKVGNETVAVCACNEKQARLAIKRVMENRVGTGIGVKIMSCTVNGQEIAAEEVAAMNTHQHAEVTEKEEKKMENKTNEIKKVALVGETVDYTALAEALKMEGKKLLVGDALNKEHLNALFRVKGGSFEGVMVQAYLAHRGETAPYTSEKLGFTPVTLSILSSMSNELRAQLMEEALTNKAFALIGNAPEPKKTETVTESKHEPQQTTTKEQSAPATPTTEEVKTKVSAKLVELGQELEAGKDVVAEINKFGSYAHQTLKMSEGDINALIQQGVDNVKVAQETEREELRKLGKELAENDMAEGDDDFHAENGLTIQDEIDAIIGDGVLSEEEARKVVKEAYDSVYVSKTTEILIPDEEESQDIPAEDNHEDELAELVLISLEGENKAASASVMAHFVLDNTNGNMEEATEIVRDILGIFSSVDEVIELDNGLVISGVLVRDGQSHKVVVTEDFQGSILA